MKIKRTVLGTKSLKKAISSSTQADEFFTKEEVVEFGDAVCDRLSNLYNDIFEVQDLWLEGNVIHLEVESQDEPVYSTGEVKIDMRRIREITDLLKYVTQMVGNISDDIDVQTLEEVDSTVDASVEQDISVSADIDYDVMRSTVDKILVANGIESIDGLEDESDGEYTYLDVKGLSDDVDMYGGTLEISIDSDYIATMNHYEQRYTDTEMRLRKIESEIDEALSSLISTVNTAESIDGAEYGLEPPDSLDLYEEDDIDEFAEFNVDMVIDIDSDGDINDHDDYGAFAANPDSGNGDWMSYEHNIRLADKTDAAEQFYDLLLSRYDSLIPTEPGKYRMIGSVTLAYSISGIQSESTPYKETDGMGDYTTEFDTEYFTDYAEVQFELNKSKIDNLEFSSVN